MPGGTDAGEFAIERITRCSPELGEAVARLTPQLSPGRRIPGEADLAAMLADDRLHLLVARSGDGVVQGMLALVFYRVPTGMRARIEDLVVSGPMRGRGFGKALLLRALQVARQEGAHVLDLTSNPSRAEANALYLRVGFQPWRTNVYRKILDAQG
jgi:GNAT superfamily N-acetyltransferase